MVDAYASGDEEAIAEAVAEYGLTSESWEEFNTGVSMASGGT